MERKTAQLYRRTKTYQFIDVALPHMVHSTGQRHTTAAEQEYNISIALTTLSGCLNVAALMDLRLFHNHLRWHNAVDNDNIIFQMEDIIPFLIVRHHSSGLRINHLYGF